MILWKDFILDDFVGPVLANIENEPAPKSCRRKRFGSPSVMEDAMGAKTETSEYVSIQETRQERWPARMVGFSSLDSASSGMEAGEGYRVSISWKRREGDRFQRVWKIILLIFAEKNEWFGRAV